MLARRMDPEWVRRIQHQCDEQRVPFFFKQWGGVRKGLTGRELDGRTYDAMPVLETQPVPAASRRAKRIEAIQYLASEPDVARLAQLRGRDAA